MNLGEGRSEGKEEGEGKTTLKGDHSTRGKMNKVMKKLRSKSECTSKLRGGKRRRGERRKER